MFLSDVKRREVPHGRHTLTPSAHSSPDVACYRFVVDQSLLLAGVS
jgi:hypothetical protein